MILFKTINLLPEEIARLNVAPQDPCRTDSDGVGGRGCQNDDEGQPPDHREHHHAG